jgi:hypothetical protein
MNYSLQNKTEFGQNEILVRQAGEKQVGTPILPACAGMREL